MFDVTEPSDDEKQNAVDYLQFIKGADLLIADGQYTQEEYNSKVDWGHTSMELLFDVAYKAGVKKLAVFHHDPDHPDELLDMIWSQTNPYYLKLSPAMQVFWAREGMTVPV